MFCLGLGLRLGFWVKVRVRVRVYSVLGLGLGLGLGVRENRILNGTKLCVPTRLAVQNCVCVFV